MFFMMQWFVSISLRNLDSFFKTNKHTSQGNLLDKWASVLLKQPLPTCSFFLFSMLHCSSGCSFCNALITITSLE